MVDSRIEKESKGKAAWACVERGESGARRLPPPAQATSRCRSAHGCRAGLLGMSLVAAGCLSYSDPPVPANAIPFGTVIPFSGSRAASGANLEEAMQLVVNEVNGVEVGGIAGRPLHMLVSDSHSDATKGKANADKLLNDDKVPYFIGTEEPEISYGIANEVKADGVVHLMPGLTSPEFSDPSTKAAWFRLAPSGEFLACALAKQMLADGIGKAAAVVTPDDYSANFASSYGSVFRNMGGTLLPSIKAQASASSYSTILSAVRQSGADATVLVATPSVAAQIIQEWSAAGQTGRWYLAPMMKDPEFLRNIPPGALDGTIGVSADIGGQSAAFSALFEKGANDTPLDSAFYYYDAAAMMSLTLATAYANLGALPTPAQFKTYMMQVASGPGTVVTFDQLATGLQLAAAGQDIEYHGAAGSYVFDARGNSVDTAAALWQISGEDFITIGHNTCVTSEIAYTYD